jgi:SPP1 family phage portal protein
MAIAKEQLLKDPGKVLIKKQFTRGVAPDVELPNYVTADRHSTAALPRRRVIAVSQDTFLEELDTYSHAIQSPYVLDDKKVLVTYKDANGEEKEREGHVPVTRIALPLQRIIATKQKTHLTGNKLQLTLANETQTEEDKLSFTELKQLFISKNMDIALSENVESQLVTGDTALLMYFDRENKLDWKTYSWKDGYCLLPHYDEYDNLILFGIYYSDSDGEKDTTFLDVWDETFKYRYRQDTTGWIRIANDKHGFKEVPVAYKRGSVAWNDVQNLIDKLELHASLWAESVRYYGDPILFLKGAIDVLPIRDEGGKTLAGMDGDADGKLLQAEESKNVNNLMDFLLKEIFRGSFSISFSPETVKTSGDLPGITVKLLFSCAIEKAIEQAKEWDSFIDKMMRLFIFACGLESKKSAQYGRLKIFGAIEPYIPQNTTEIINNINSSKTQGTLSTETSTDIHPYAAADENKRVTAEAEAEREKGKNTDNKKPEE